MSSPTHGRCITRRHRWGGTADRGRRRPGVKHRASLDLGGVPRHRRRLFGSDAAQYPRLPRFIEAYGGRGEHIEDSDNLRPALERAVDVWRSGRQALTSVRISYPDTAIH